MSIGTTTLQLMTENNYSREEIKQKLISVNYHLIKACNYRCSFCFAHFNQVTKNYIPKEDATRLIDQLANFGTRKITFVGGEPTLVPFLPELVSHAKSSGMTTMIVTNGSKISREYLERFGGTLDWVGLSIDSSIEEVSKELGRGEGRHVKQTIWNVRLLREAGIRIKLNTVVTKKTWNEDMGWLIEKIQPDRWKVFKMLLIKGENDNAKDLGISDIEFEYFIAKHQQFDPTVENNDTMTDSYVMIDPEGRFYNNSDGVMSHGESILEVGIEKAFSFSNFNYKKFEKRGGKYSWE
jgi:radical S-adenosyl methionine domain-containing protein 2